jgi:hypothetical protein
MDIQILAGLLIGGIAVIFSLLLGVVFLLDLKGRPEGTLQNYKARFSPSVFQADEVERAFVHFEQEWLKRDPKAAKKLRKMLNRMNVRWQDRRWRRIKLIEGQHKPRIVAAELTHNYTIKVWIGPRIPQKPRSIAYTGLTGALVQATLYNLYGEVAEDISAYKPLILTVNLKLLKDDNVARNGLPADSSPGVQPDETLPGSD